MKPNEHAQIEFIKDYLRKGAERKDILQPFTKLYKTSIKTFDTRLKAATIAVQAEFKRIDAKVEQSIERSADALKSKILTAMERQVVLSEIAKGEKEIEKIFLVQGKLQKTKAMPDHSDITKAIAELNKMDGSYRPSKVEATVTEIKINFKDAE